MMSILTLAAFSCFASLTYASRTANFIANGHNANPHSAPYIVAIHSFQPGFTPGYSPGHIICGGSILNKNWVLTAAHCVVSRYVELSTIQVLAGRHDLRMTDKEENGQSRGLKKIIVHKSYKTGEAHDDIALLKVAEPFEFNENITAIRLPLAHGTHEGEATLFGWGSISLNYSMVFPSILQTANLSLLSYDVCETVLKRSFHPTFICTDGFENSGACYGDSGGPLVQYKEDGESDLIGVSSWMTVVKCGTQNAPSLFIKVSYFIDWINGVTQELVNDSDDSS